jgi:hypothetical protein
MRSPVEVAILLGSPCLINISTPAAYVEESGSSSRWQINGGISLCCPAASKAVVTTMTAQATDPSMARHRENSRETRSNWNYVSGCIVPFRFCDRDKKYGSWNNTTSRLRTAPITDALSSPQADFLVLQDQ